MIIDVPPSHKRRLSMTPLIDVVFILLLFFMLASSFIEWREIELNMAGHAKYSSQAQRPLIVRMTDQELYLAGKAITPLQLLEQVHTQLTANAGLAVVLQPQAEVSLQRIITLLDQLRDEGVRSVSFVRDAVTEAR